jgi:methylmalonyl-CoA mutase N-terminal domain/subunit
VEFHPYKEEDARAQIAGLEAVRAKRDAVRVKQALAQVRADAHAGANVMPAIIAAVKAYASVGEITRELVGVYGQYREPIRF